jgi:PPK2 family polyphosphate:nucleotide phosphotransferase
MKLNKFIADENLILSNLSTDVDFSKEDAKDKLNKNLEKLAELQEKFYAESKHGMIILIQAMDTAGKDGIVKYVFTAFNPQGTIVSNFKQPTSTELKHDYLWRASYKLPERGQIGIFNRSYYEEVLVVKVHNLVHNQNIPEHLITDDIWNVRYREINDYEKYLNENGFIVVKLFLNISKEEQKRRLLNRIDDQSKNWKFSEADLKERQYWNDYMNSYQELLKNTSSKNSPWYIIPSDKKWYSRYVVSEIIVNELEKLDLKFPELDQKHTDALKECKKQLLEE